MKEEDNVTLGFDCPYCGYQYQLTGMKVMDRRVKCGNCDSKFMVRSKMSTVTIKKSKKRPDTVFDI